MKACDLVFQIFKMCFPQWEHLAFESQWDQTTTMGGDKSWKKTIVDKEKLESKMLPKVEDNRSCAESCHGHRHSTKNHV
jgi:hypothetical protein